MKNRARKAQANTHPAVLAPPPTARPAVACASLHPEIAEMTACDAAADISSMSVRPSALPRVGLGAVRFVTLWRNRRAFNRLCDLTETGLADIGISRGDLHDARDVPFTGDPTARLMAIADARADAMVLARPV